MISWYVANQQQSYCTYILVTSKQIWLLRRESCTWKQLDEWQQGKCLTGFFHGRNSFLQPNVKACTFRGFYEDGNEDVLLLFKLSDNLSSWSLKCIEASRRHVITGQTQIGIFQSAHNTAREHRIRWAQNVNKLVHVPYVRHMYIYTGGPNMNNKMVHKLSSFDQTQWAGICAWSNQLANIKLPKHPARTLYVHIQRMLDIRGPDCLTIKGTFAWSA